MMKQMKKSDLVLATFPEIKLPSRSKPGDFFSDFEVAMKRIPPGHVVEIDAAKVTEHRARRYLAILAMKDPRYHEFTVRTAAGDVRRRVFVANGENVAAQLEIQR
jgi:hypothetical protein